MPIPAITQALGSLLPSFPASGKPFPAALASQCESLLALSRQRHPNLKADEEIARAHVCVEIACNRLRAPLRLPAIKNGAGAPCKPTVYKKLYKFLDASLVDAAIGSLTPRGTKRTAQGSVKESGGSRVDARSAARNNLDDTPSKKRVVDKMIGLEFTGAIKGKGKKKETNMDPSNRDDKAPSFVMPQIRRLSKAFSAPSMVPHVYTGLCVVLELSELWSASDPIDLDDEDEEEASNGDRKARKVQIQTLMVALFLMVLTKMRKGKMTPVIYSRGSSKGIEVTGLDDSSETLTQIEEWIQKLNAEGWCSGQDWWDSVPEDVIVLDENDTTQDATNDADTTDDIIDFDLDTDSRSRSRSRTTKSRHDKTTSWREIYHIDLDGDDPDGVLLPGLGTMLNASNDWTSEERNVDYQHWKEDILRRIAAFDRPQSTKRKGKSIAVTVT